MTDQEFIKKWIGFCGANGVTEQPSVEVGDGLKVEGYTPPTNLVWRTSTGTLTQGVALLQQTDEPAEFVKHVQFAYGVPLGLKVGWKEYLNPPQVSVDSSDPMVGDVFDPTRRLFYVKGSGVQEWSKYEPTAGPKAGRKFVAVRIAGPFTLHWQEK